MITMTLAQSFSAQRIIEDRNLTKTIEDWSGCRSPSRARRRRRQGHPQRMVYRQVPDPSVYYIDDALVMHPETARAMERRMVESMARVELKMLEEGTGDWI
jgi:hypothetical protein